LLTEEKRFAGFIVGVYLIEQMIEEIMQVETAKGLNLTEYEGNRVDEKHHLYGTLIEDRAMELTFPVNIAGRPWFRRLAKIVRGVSALKFLRLQVEPYLLFCFYWL
jgi:hypothetical protein